MNEFKIENHESYAQLGISRSSSNRDVSLYGSSIKHHNTITIRIHPSEKQRGLNSDWFHAKNVPYIEVEMSNTQFAETITSLNMGDGVPCTLRYLNGKKIENCPDENKRIQFENEFAEQMKNINNKLNNLTKRTEEILIDKKVPTKGDKEEILSAIKMLKQEVKSNIPYIGSCFNEQMDKTVLEAKGEVEAFVNNKVNSLGIEGLKNEMIMLNENNIVDKTK